MGKEAIESNYLFIHFGVCIMRIGIGNRIASFLGIRYSLLLPKYRNRNPRAIAFQKAFRKDFEGSKIVYHNTLVHFRKLGFFASDELFQFITTIAAIHKNHAQEKELFITLERWTKTSKSPTAGQWLEVSMYLLSMGFFQAAYKARVLSYCNFNSMSNKLVYSLNYNILKSALHFDNGENEKLRHLEQDLRVSVYWQAIFGGITTKSVKDDNATFFKLINKKRVAVIGPLEFSKDYSSEIDSYDIVVELNALLSKREAVRKKYHGKPDIVYYSNFRLDELEKIDYTDVVDTAKHAVLKTNKHLNKLINKLPTRVLASTSILNWNGSFSMMENAVADLLLFKPAELKIFGVNIYTSFNYDKSYGNSPPENIKQITLNFTVHDIFTQYMFMNNLYKLGLIGGDHDFEQVLQLGIEGYIMRMSELYPKFLLTNESE